MKRIFLLCSFLFIFFFSFSYAFAENIDPQNEGNDFAVLHYDDSQINFDCDSCGVEVSSSQIFGYAWGESVGWINLQPTSSGVVNDGNGNLSGYAWGENTGWINFNPSFGGVSISNGEFDGYAWSENYGWIQFDCSLPDACVETSWTADGSSGGGSSGGGGGGSGFLDPNPDPVFGCTNSNAENYNPLATVNDGGCVFDASILGCTISNATNYNPYALVDDNSCQFGDTPVPTEPPTEPIDTGSVSETEEDSEIPEEGSSSTSQEEEQEVQDFPYTVTRERLGDTLGLVSLLILGLSLLAIPLQQLMQAPTRAFQLLVSWFGIGSKKHWGVIFDSITKRPLDPVVVSLVDIHGKVVQTSITDMEGRYGFVAQPGLYTLDARKADYRFPSYELKDKTSDGIYDDLYVGGTFQILDKGEIVRKNIPLDPINFNWNEFEKKRIGLGEAVVRKQKIYKYSNIIFIFGFSFSIVALFFSPIFWNYIILGLYIVMSLLRICGIPKHSGSVVRNGQPLSFGVMRVYSNTLKKEIKKVVLDDVGNYYCLIRNGEYYITLESRNSDGMYTLVYTSEPFRVRRGAIKKKFII